MRTTHREAATSHLQREGPPRFCCWATTRTADLGARQRVQVGVATMPGYALSDQSGTRAARGEAGRASMRASRRGRDKPASGPVHTSKKARPSCRLGGLAARPIFKPLFPWPPREAKSTKRGARLRGLDDGRRPRPRSSTHGEMCDKRLSGTRRTNLWGEAASPRGAWRALRRRPRWRDRRRW